MSDRSGWLNPKKYPKGHMIFRSDDKEGVVIHGGRPYAMNGMPLPVDVAWLRKNNYLVNEHVQRALRPPEPEKKVRNCESCRSVIAMESKYCPECGARQQLWLPGAGGDGDRIKALIDPEDPLSALDAILNPLDPEALAASRRRPSEDLTSEELSRELGSLAHGSLEAVPGEGARPTNPKLEKKAHGRVEFARPVSSGVVPV